ncbi:MAG: rod shape-determining protein MreD [Actinomycetes bacterium]
MRAFLTGPLVRLFPVGLCVLAMQRTFLTELKVMDVVLQIVHAHAAGAGAGAGPERGAIAGFTLGLMYDLATGSPLGLTALVYALAGFVAGYVLTFTPTPPWWLASLFVGIGAAVGETAAPAARALIGQDGWFTSQLFTIVPVVTVFALVISPLAVPLGRWCMCVKRPKWKAMHE